MAFLGAGLGILAVSGCRIFHLGGPERPVFSHRLHVVEKKLECSDCHADYEESEEAGMPVREICEPCHGDLDKDKPPLQRASAFFTAEGEPTWSHVTKLPDEVNFSHKVHHEKSVECSECHRGVSESEAISSRLAMGKPECMDCHARRGTSNDCAVCHKKIRKDVKPENHLLAWIKTHGHDVRGDQRSNCTLCHTESSCSRCHQEVPPENHTNYWRQRGHGFAAAIDRDNCKACHQADYCERCHQDIEPRSHMGSFASTLQTHCLSCHAPLSSVSCGACHRGTPSHSMATPLPSSHNPAMNCRQCHGVGEPLPHVDNGDSCISCHR